MNVFCEERRKDSRLYKRSDWYLILIRKIIDLKYKEEIEYDAWVEEIGKANNKIIDKFEHFYVEINRGKQVD